MKLEYLERAIKANFILTNRTDRSLTGAKEGEEMWPLYIFCGLAKEYDYNWKEIADYLGYFVEEVKDFYINSRNMRLKKLMALINKKSTQSDVDDFYVKYKLVRSSVSHLTKPFINEFNIYQK